MERKYTIKTSLTPSDSLSNFDVVLTRVWNVDGITVLYQGEYDKFVSPTSALIKLVGPEDKISELEKS